MKGEPIVKTVFGKADKVINRDRGCALIELELDGSVILYGDFRMPDLCERLNGGTCICSSSLGCFRFPAAGEGENHQNSSEKKQSVSETIKN